MIAGGAQAATGPANVPEGYKWLPGYVEEFKADGTISGWFSESLVKYPDDFALLGLKAYFDSKGDKDAARALFQKRGGSAKDFDAAMACAKVK